MIGRAQQPQPQLHRARELAAAATTCVVLAEPAVVVPRLGGNIAVALEVRGWCRQRRLQACNDSRCRACPGLTDGQEARGRLRAGLRCLLPLQEEDWEETAEELDDMFLGDAELWR